MIEPGHKEIYEQLKSLDRKTDDTSERLVRLETRLEEWRIQNDRMLMAIAQNNKDIQELQLDVTKARTRMTTLGTVGAFLISACVSFISSTLKLWGN